VSATRSGIRASMLPATGRDRSFEVGNPAMQTARPRDLGALALVVGMFLVLLVISIAFGSPVVR
jgi:hypothetical protein